MSDGMELMTARNIFDEARVMAYASTAESFSLGSGQQHDCIQVAAEQRIYTSGTISNGTIWISPQPGNPWHPNQNPQPYEPYVGGSPWVYPQPGIQPTSPPFAPPLTPLPDPYRVPERKDYTVPVHNYEPHYDIHGDYVGCKHCPYDNVHKADPASHPFTIFEE